MTRENATPRRPASPADGGAWSRGYQSSSPRGTGALFGKRRLLLRVGCVSGLDRMVVLESVACDPNACTWIEASGFGSQADWYRYPREQSKTLRRLSNSPHAVTADFFSPREGAEIMAAYTHRQPRTARRLCACMGLPSPETAAQRAERSQVTPRSLRGEAPGQSLSVGLPQTTADSGGRMTTRLSTRPPSWASLRPRCGVSGPSAGCRARRPSTTWDGAPYATGTEASPLLSGGAVHAQG